ncbi:SPFH domain-containing protein [Maribacter sp. 2-571]|uniref:SPFH domain-containing protein n=1 Tax=Maribacter sp. 2-571 TaxID=3417569 RepID=UPI003D32F74B
MDIKKQMRSVIQWEHPKEYQLFFKFTDQGDELKNASKLILQPGQGCIFTYEGKVEGVFEEEGLYDLATGNKPFLTTMRKFMNAFESEHKTGIWFYRKADMVNIRWGTRIPITYNDPVYAFPVKLRAYGNYSLRISRPENFFRNILAGQQDYFVDELQEVFLSRITQPISNYLANAKFSYAEIDANMENVAGEAKNKTISVFEELGFQLLDFRIEGNSFDQETNDRINEISDVQAEVHSANIAGVDFAELQKLKAMRDMAKNEGAAGAGMGMFAGMQMGNTMGQPASEEKTEPAQPDVRSKLKELKALFEDDLISEEEFRAKKQQLLEQL